MSQPAKEEFNEMVSEKLGEFLVLGQSRGRADGAMRLATESTKHTGEIGRILLAMASQWLQEVQENKWELNGKPCVACKKLFAEDDLHHNGACDGCTDKWEEASMEAADIRREYLTAKGRL